MNKIKYILRKCLGVLCKNPDFLIIGVQKGGTTSLYNFLNQHSSINLSKHKEIHFFDKKYNYGFFWYRSFFPFLWDKRLSGEATPYYIYHPLVAKRVKDKYPKIKIIVLLRNPLDRAISHYNMEVHRGREQSKDILSLFNLEPGMIKKETQKLHSNPDYQSDQLQHNSYFDRGNYSQQIKRWYQYFNKEQILILKSEDLFNNNKNKLSKVLEFLNINASENISFPKDNTSSSSNNLSFNIELLKEHFREKVEELEDYTNRDFKWKI